MARSYPPDSEPSAESDEGRSAPQRSPEKTIGITPSQILDISSGSSAQAAQKAPRRRTPDLSMWLGNVLSSSEFAPEAGRAKRRGPWRILGVLVVVGSIATAGVLVWRSWPKVPFSSSEWPGLAKKSSTPVAPPVAPVAGTAAPDTKAKTPELPTPAAPANESPAERPAPVQAAPTEEPVVKKSHSTKHSSKHKRGKRHRRKRSKAT